MSTLAHVRDHLTHGDLLAVVHEQLPVMGIRRQQAIGVLDDDQITVAAQTAARIDDPTGTRSAHVLPQTSGQ